MALLNNVLPFALIFAGQTLITVGPSSIINAMTPLITVIVMAAFQQERLTLQRSVGVALGAAGAAILHGFDGATDGPQTLGMGLCLASASSYGFAALWGRYLAGVPPLMSATCQLICSTLVMLPVVALIDRPWTLNAPTHATLLALLALAVLGTALAYIVFFHILVRAGASNVMLVTLLIPVTAMLMGNIFLEEPLRPKDMAGAIVIARAHGQTRGRRLNRPLPARLLCLLAAHFLPALWMKVRKPTRASGYDTVTGCLLMAPVELWTRLSSGWRAAARRQGLPRPGQHRVISPR
jgi:drug/metabolite transporter (DMT)-like permease